MKEQLVTVRPVHPTYWQQICRSVIYLKTRRCSTYAGVCPRVNFTCGATFNSIFGQLVKLNTRALGGDFGFLSDSYKADWFRRLSLYAIWSVCICRYIWFSSGDASCAEPNGPSVRSSGCRRCTWRVWPRCVSGSVWWARRIERSASRSSPMCIGTASRLQKEKRRAQRRQLHTSGLFLNFLKQRQVRDIGTHQSNDQLYLNTPQKAIPLSHTQPFNINAK